MTVLIRPSAARAMNGATALAVIEQTLERAGAKMPSYPEVKRARALIETERALSAEFQSAASTHATNQALAAELIEGNVSVGQAIVAAAEAAASEGKAAQALRDATMRRTAGLVVEELRKVGDKWITDVLRPIVAPIVAELEGMVDLIEKCGPHGPSKGHEDRETRDRWTRLNDLAADLEAVHNAADSLRNMSIIPASNRDISDEYRWARLDKLGSLSAEPLAILANIANGAEAGIYTETETAEHVARAKEAQAPSRAEAVARRVAAIKAGVGAA